MNFRKITEEELADFAANVLLLLAGPDLPAIESHARAEFVTALGTLPALLAAETATAKV